MTSGRAIRHSLVDGSWGWFPLLTIAGGASALMLSAAYGVARLALPGGEILYWVAFTVAALPIFAVLVLPDRPRRERIALVGLLGVQMVVADRLRSPLSFTGYDELLHVRSLADILRSGHLFQPNPLLTVSPYFPGLEIVTSAVAQVSGADPYAAGVVVIGFIRLIFTTALFLLFEEVSESSRIAGIAAALYAVSPSFVSFDGAFAYESLALPLIPLILFVVARWARSGSRSTRTRLSAALGILLAALILTHHLTSYALLALVAGWAIIQWLVRGRDRYRTSVAMIALLAAVGVGLWLFTIASLTLGYLIPPLNATIQQAIRLVGSGQSRQLFQSATGSVAPLWQRLEAIGGTGIMLACLLVGLVVTWRGGTGIMLACLLVGLVVTWRRFRGNSLAILLMVVSLGYPASLALRLTVSGAEVAARSSAVLYIGLAFVAANGLLGFGEASRWVVGHLGRLGAAVASSVPAAMAGRTVATFAISGLLVAGVIVGISPAIRFPGPYAVEADARSIDAESLAAAAWARQALGEDRVMAADRVNRLLLGAYALEDVVFDHPGGSLTWEIFLSPGVGTFETTTIRNLSLEYLLIDRRLARGLPVFGIYYEQGEIAAGPHTTPVTLQVLTKWNLVPQVSRIFDSGGIQIYDVRRLSGAT